MKRLANLQDTPLEMAGTQLDMADLGNQVRHWVHYDNLVSKLNKEVLDNRNKRQHYETLILQKLKATNHEKAVLQIVGGRILVSEERHTKPLTLASLETTLQEYYRHKSTPGKDETADIMKFIKGHRTTDTIQRLKRQITDTKV
jgi:IS1 family transposase